MEQRTGDARRASPGCEIACCRYSGSKTKPLASSGDLPQHEKVGHGQGKQILREHQVGPGHRNRQAAAVTVLLAVPLRGISGVRRFPSQLVCDTRRADSGLLLLLPTARHGGACRAAHGRVQSTRRHGYSRRPGPLVAEGPPSDRAFTRNT